MYIYICTMYMYDYVNLERKKSYEWQYNITVLYIYTMTYGLWLIFYWTSDGILNIEYCKTIKTHNFINILHVYKILNRTILNITI